MFRKFLSTLVVCFLFFNTLAQTKSIIQGDVNQGGKVVRVSSTLSYIVQESFPNAIVTVYNIGTITLAYIYSNSSGTVKSNPFTADSKGLYEFYAGNGAYDIKFSGVGISIPFTRTVNINATETPTSIIAINVASCATGGDGTMAHPWTGWNNTGNCVWAGKNYTFGGLADGTPGTYILPSIANWSFGSTELNPFGKPISVDGNNALIYYTGSGRAIEIKSAADSNPNWLRGVNVRNLRLRNTGTGTEGIYINGSYASLFTNLEVSGFSSKNYHLRAVVQDHFDIISSLSDTPYTTDPFYISDDILSSDNDFTGLNFVRATHSSIYVGSCQNSWFTGTGEGNDTSGGLGLICNTACRGNVFKLDNEDNEIGGTGRDFSVDGYNNLFLSSISTGLVRLTANSKYNIFQNGLYNKIQVDTGAKGNEFHHTMYNISGTGTFVDNGTDTRVYICYFGTPTNCLNNISPPPFYSGGQTGIGGYKIVEGGLGLVAGTGTITLIGTHVFTSNLTYQCFFSNLTSSTNPQVKYAIISGSQFTVTGTGSDTIGFVCIGY